MKEIILNTSITSVIAVMLIGGSFFPLGYLAVHYGSDATTRTQLITGLLTSLGAVTGYYFGAAKNRPAQANTGTGDINVNAPTEPATTV